MDKKKWYASLLATITAAGVLAGQWSNFEAFADWLLKVSGLILERPTIQAVIVSILCGLSVAVFIPHIPAPCLARWSPTVTKFLTRLTAVVISATFCAILLQPDTTAEWVVAFPYCTLSAGMSSALWTTLQGPLYRVVKKPESLKP